MIFEKYRKTIKVFEGNGAFERSGGALYGDSAAGIMGVGYAEQPASNLRSAIQRGQGSAKVLGTDDRGHPHLHGLLP